MERRHVVFIESHQRGIIESHVGPQGTPRIMFSGHWSDGDEVLLEIIVIFLVLTLRRVQVMFDDRKIPVLLQPFSLAFKIFT